jgi:putative transposase
VELYELSLLGYCLMSNHVHLVVIPRKAAALALAFKHTHGRYATYWNASHQSSGHAWQGRFYSCALDQSHLWAALRYAERNPVRAGLVAAAEEWRWSSAAVHCGLTANDGGLELGQRQERWDSSSWLQYLREKDSEEETAAIRQCTHTGRPLGTAEFVQAMENATQRCLTPLSRGRPRKTADERQGALAFDRD